MKKLFALAFIALLVFIIRTNPYLLRALFADEAQNFTPPSIYPTLTLVNEKTLSTNATSTYRGNATRTGENDKESLDLNIQEVWRSEQINFAVHSASKSSPAVDATGIYIGSDRGWFYKFSPSGHLEWKIQIARARRGIHGTALLDENYVYFGGYNGKIYCLKKTDGALVWQTQLLHAIGSSPVLGENSLYISSEKANIMDGALYKLDRQTGNVIWVSSSFQEQVHSSPTLDEKNNRVYVGANNGYLFAFDARDGHRLWATKLADAIKSTALLYNGILYVTSWGAELSAINSDSGLVRWQVKLESKSQSSPTLDHESRMLVFGAHFSPALYGVSIDSQSIVWNKKFSEAPRLQVMASGLSIAQKSKGPPLIWISCGSKKLCAIVPPTGEIMRELILPAELTGEPAVFDGILYVALDNGPLVAYGSALKTP